MADVREIFAQGPVYQADGTVMAAGDLFGPPSSAPAAPAGGGDGGGGPPGGWAAERVVGVYMSASYCPPCRQFTPLLARVYTKLKERGAAVEFVWVPWDEDEEDCAEYGAKMPFPRLGFQDDRADALSRLYGTETIPTLVMLRARDGKVLSRHARGAVVKDPEAANYPWVDEDVVASL